MNNTIVFDLDGVITSEEAYWVAAGLVLHELLYSPHYWNINGASAYVPPQTQEECGRVSREVLPEAVILNFKGHSINSNWDTCYAAVSICLIDLLAQIPTETRSTLFPLQPGDDAWIARFRSTLRPLAGSQMMSAETYARLRSPLFEQSVGLAFLDHFNTYASEVLGQTVEGVFARYSASWLLCCDLFQEWYLGDEGYARAYGHAPVQSGKIGCINFERPMLPLEQLRLMLQTLRDEGYTLGIATGRPGQEAILPLKHYDLFGYFDADHVVTHSEVVLAEEDARARGEPVSLVKPHPYQFLAAAYPGYKFGQPLPEGGFIVVGDTPSDVAGAHEANALIVAVLTGARNAETCARLEQSQPDFIVPDVTHVPALLASLDDLATIQRMQFSEREKAQMLLQRWFARHMELSVDSVTLTPKAVSLNSFNGVYRVDDGEFFFKTHVEEQGSIDEYYHAELLYNTGYRIVKPLHTLHQQGRQMVIYPVVHEPVMFDLMRAVEQADTREANSEMLVMAEQRECERLLHIYQETLAQSTASEHAQAPIHQLFWHRLTGGRLDTFYSGQFFPFSADERSGGIPFADLLRCRWVINGEPVIGEYATLGALIERAKTVLQPTRAMSTIVGHGDAHFGNVFLEQQRDYRYFDPAFAGRHSPLLDIVKPLFHNVYATWMYFPYEVARAISVTVERRADTLFVTHNYSLSALRQALLETKRTYLLEPLLALLRERDALPSDWADIVQTALLCCPLLTVNLSDRSKRPVSTSWLGLMQSVQMGNFAL